MHVVGIDSQYSRKLKFAIIFTLYYIYKCKSVHIKIPLDNVLIWIVYIITTSRYFFYRHGIDKNERCYFFSLHFYYKITFKKQCITIAISRKLKQKVCMLFLGTNMNGNEWVKEERVSQDHQDNVYVVVGRI